MAKLKFALGSMNSEVGPNPPVKLQSVSRSSIVFPLIAPNPRSTARLLQILSRSNFGQQFGIVSQPNPPCRRDRTASITFRMFVRISAWLTAPLLVSVIVLGLNRRSLGLARRTPRIHPAGAALQQSDTALEPALRQKLNWTSPAWCR